MKYKITAEEFEKLSEEFKGEYTQDGDYATLKIDGDDAPSFDKMATLEKKRELEVEHRKKAEAKLRESDERAAKLQDDLENAGNNKDEIQKIKEAHSKELEALRQERAEESARVKADRDNALIKEEAAKFASSHFVDAPYGSKFIANEMSKRLVVEEVGGAPVVRVQNTDGTPSTASISDLQKEFLDNKDFSPIIKAKVGSGGGATPNNGGGATRKSISEMTATEEAAFEKEEPEAYAAAIGIAS